MNARRTSMILGIGLLLLAVVVLFNGYTLAKYFMEKGQKVPAVAKSFYFESDLLAASDAVPQYTLQAGVDEISVNLMNYPDELRASEVDIRYSVSLMKEGSQIGSISGTIEKGSNTVPISFENLSAGTYTVTATATSPYTQTLQGRFTIVETDSALSYTVSDESRSPNLKVTVTTTDFGGNIVITWPEGVLPDDTDPLLEEASGHSCTVKVKEQSEYTFQFFKTNPQANYTESIGVSIPNS